MNGRKILIVVLLAAGGFAAYAVWKRREQEGSAFDLEAALSGKGFFSDVSAVVSEAVATVTSVFVNPKVKAFAEAIARAEGFYAAGNPLPRRTNNPGDLKASSIAGVGYEQGKIVFASVADGWRALYRQVELWLSGKSRVADANVTIAALAVKYTGGDNAAAWARIVAGALGVTPQTTLREYFG